MLFEKILEIDEKITVMMSLDYPAAVNVNFGETNFLYNINNIDSSSSVISSNNKFINNNFTIKNYEYETNDSKLHLSLVKKIKFKKDLCELLLKDNTIIDNDDVEINSLEYDDYINEEDLESEELIAIEELNLILEELQNIVDD